MGVVGSLEVRAREPSCRAGADGVKETRMVRELAALAARVTGRG